MRKVKSSITDTANSFYARPSRSHHTTLPGRADTFGTDVPYLIDRQNLDGLSKLGLQPPQ